MVVLSRFPFPLEKGDKLRAYHQLKELHKFYNIFLVCVSDRNIPKEEMDHIEQYCSSVHIGRINLLSKFVGILTSLFNGNPFQTGYFFKRAIKKEVKSIIQINEVKHIYCQLLRTAEFVKYIHEIPKSLDYMDALSTGIERRVDLQPFYKKWLFKIEAKRLKRYERHIFDYFEIRTIISDQDKKQISHPDRESIISIPNGIESSFFKDYKHTDEYDLVFVGNMSYPPNIEAAHYIVDNILPHIDNASLLLSGATPHSSLKKLAAKNKNVHLSGWVDDIKNSYLSGKVFIAPMMIGTGMQNKLLEAMALKTPCITTSLANNAIQGNIGTEILVGNTKDELIDACKTLLNNEELRTTIAENGHKMVKENYNWQNSTLKLIELIDNTFKQDNS